MTRNKKINIYKIACTVHGIEYRQVKVGPRFMETQYRYDEVDKTRFI